MKYRIKNIRRAGWVETEEKLFRPAEEAAPITPPEDTAEDNTQIYIIPDKPEAPNPEDTVIFSAETLPPLDNKPKKDGDGKTNPLIAFLKTKEGKIVSIVTGVFALLLTVFIIVAVCLGASNDKNTDSGQGNAGGSTDHKHEYQTIVNTAATCTETGITKKECSVCGYTESEETVDALGHKWRIDKAVSVEATCEKEGETVKLCERCNEKEIDKTAAKDHVWKADDNESIEASCGAEGKEVKKCEECGKTETVTLEALEHDWEEDHSDQATCDKDGTVVKECKICGEKETEKQQAKGHTWIQTTTEEATCAEEGKINFRCASCTETKTELTAKKEHEMSKPTRTEPTCAKEGKEVSSCKNCAEESVTVLPKLPHNTTPATCLEGEKCKDCGAVISATAAHTYENGMCTVCHTVAPFTGTRSAYVTTGTKIRLSNGIDITVEGYYVSGDSLVMNIALTVTDAYLTTEYTLAQDAISIYRHDDFEVRESPYTSAGELFNISKAGTVHGTLTLHNSGSGEYLVRIIGDTATHVCSVAVLP